MARRLTLVSNKDSEFRRITGLRLEKWSGHVADRPVNRCSVMRRTKHALAATLFAAMAACSHPSPPAGNKADAASDKIAPSIDRKQMRLGMRLFAGHHCWRLREMLERERTGESSSTKSTTHFSPLYFALAHDAA